MFPILLVVMKDISVLKLSSRTMLIPCRTPTGRRVRRFSFHVWKTRVGLEREQFFKWSHPTMTIERKPLSVPTSFWVEFLCSKPSANQMPGIWNHLFRSKTDLAHLVLGLISSREASSSEEEVKTKTGACEIPYTSVSDLEGRFAKNLWGVEARLILALLSLILIFLWFKLLDMGKVHSLFSFSKEDGFVFIYSL